MTAVSDLMPPAFIARRVAVAIEAARIDVSSEIAAHRSIADILNREGLDLRQEVDLGPFGRVDLMAGPVAIEVKVRGARRDILKQTLRYLDAPEVSALVLATAAAWPRSALRLLRETGYPIHIASLTRGWL